MEYTNKGMPRAAALHCLLLQANVYVATHHVVADQRVSRTPAIPSAAAALLSVALFYALLVRMLVAWIVAGAYARTSGSQAKRPVQADDSIIA